MSEETEERINLVLDIYGKIINNPNKIEAVVNQTPVIGVACSELVLRHQEGVLNYLLKTYDTNKSHTAQTIASDRILHLLQTDANNILQRYVANAKTGRKIHVYRNPSEKRSGVKVTHTLRYGYLRSLSEQTHTKTTRKIYTDLTLRQLTETYNKVRHLKEKVTSLVRRWDVHGRLKRVLLPSYEKLVDRWNNTDPTVLLSPEVDLTIMNDYQIRVNFRTVSGRKFPRNSRYVDHWLIDGRGTHAWKDEYSAFREDQKGIVLRNPTKWLTLENYHLFNGEEHLCIERIDKDMLDPTEEVVGLSIAHGDVPLYLREFVFYRRVDGDYIAINSNKLEAKQFVQQMKLAKQLTK